MFEYRHRTLLIAIILFAAIGLNADRPVDVIHVPPARPMEPPVLNQQANRIIFEIEEP